MFKARRAGELRFVSGSRWLRNLRISYPRMWRRRYRRRRLLLRQRQPGIHSGGNQILPELIDGRELKSANSETARAFDVFQLIVQEERFFGRDAEAIQQQLVDCRIRLDQPVLVAPDQNVEILDPGKFLQDDFQYGVAHIR